MASLSSGLYKYEGTSKDRVPILLNKILNEQAFTICDKNKNISTVVFCKTEYKKVKQWVNCGGGGSLLIKTTGGNYVPLSYIVKTKEFGGESTGYRTSTENFQILEISKLLNEAKGDKNFVHVKVGNRIVEAASVAKTLERVNGKEPKSDMTIYDQNDQPVAWVSLKDRKFQWSKWSTVLKNNTPVSEWVNKVKKKTENELAPGQVFAYKTDKQINDILVYGKDYGSSPGPNNVDCVLIGNVYLDPSDDYFILSADKVYNNGNEIEGGEKPYLMIRYNFARRDLGFENAMCSVGLANDGRRLIWLD